MQYMRQFVRGSMEPCRCASHSLTGCLTSSPSLARSRLRRYNSGWSHCEEITAPLSKKKKKNRHKTLLFWTVFSPKVSLYPPKSGSAKHNPSPLKWDIEGLICPLYNLIIYAKAFTHTHLLFSLDFPGYQKWFQKKKHDKNFLIW